MPWAKPDYSLEDCEANTRQAIAHFLTQAEWDAPELLWQKAQQILKQLGLRLDIFAPTPKNPSMTSALDAYIKEANKR